MVTRTRECVIDDFPEIAAFEKYYDSVKYGIAYFRKNEGIAGGRMIIEGEEKINYSTYNYLGLNGDKRINEFVMEAVEHYGTSVSGSRLLSGEIELHERLERQIAGFLGTEDAIVFVGGHSTNVNIIGNISMFIPVGACWPFCFKRLNTVWKSILAGFGLTLFIELSQLVFYDRCSDIDDLIMNGTGAIIGSILYFIFRRKTVGGKES